MDQTIGSAASLLTSMFHQLPWSPDDERDESIDQMLDRHEMYVSNSEEEDQSDQSDHSDQSDQSHDDTPGSEELGLSSELQNFAGFLQAALNVQENPDRLHDLFPQGNRWYMCVCMCVCVCVW